MSNRFDAATLALDSIGGFSDDEREAVVELLRIGRAGLTPPREGSVTPLTALAERAFTWPEFDRWQAFFAARDAFPARWDGLHAVPSPRTLPAALEAYQLRKLDLLFEWLDTLTRRDTALGHYTRQGIRARIVRQGDGQRCPVCEPFTTREVTQGSDTMPPFHPGCRCVLMAVNPDPQERIRTHGRHRSRASS